MQAVARYPLVALVVNALVHRRSLYRVEEFYAGQDVALLFGPGVRADDFNNDALARAPTTWPGPTSPRRAATGGRDRLVHRAGGNGSP